MTKCHSWGYALSVTVASKDTCVYRRGGENIREYTKLDDEGPYGLRSLNFILWQCFHDKNSNFKSQTHLVHEWINRQHGSTHGV